MKTNMRIYSFQYIVLTIFYHSFNTPDVYERRFGLFVFMKLCLVYAISRYRPCKNCFSITHRWEQTQQMCEMRKEIYFSPISMRSWPSPHESCS